MGNGRPIGGDDTDGGYAYSTTLRRQSSHEHGHVVPILDWQPSPSDSGFHHRVLGYIRRRAEGLGLLRERDEYLPMSVRDEVELAVGGVRRDISGSDTLEEIARRAEHRRTTETPSAKFAHMSIEVSVQLRI